MIAIVSYLTRRLKTRHHDQTTNFRNTMQYINITLISVSFSQRHLLSLDILTKFDEWYRFLAFRKEWKGIISNICSSIYLLNRFHYHSYFKMNDFY